MRFLFLSLVAVLFFFSGCEDKKVVTQESKNGSELNDDEARKKEAQKEPTFNLISYDGESLKVTKKKSGLVFEGLEDKIILLNFFATWCPPCKAEIPHLINLQNRYSDSFKVIGVVMEDNKKNSDILEFVEEFKINYFIANSPENYQLAKGLGGVKSIPFMILYDKSGEYQTHYIGAVPEEMIEHDIKKALAK